MSHNITSRVDRLEWHRPVNGHQQTSIVPTHSFDYEDFERRFREAAETEPGFIDRWLNEQARHAAE